MQELQCKILTHSYTHITLPPPLLSQEKLAKDLLQVSYNLTGRLTPNTRLLLLRTHHIQYVTRTKNPPSAASIHSRLPRQLTCSPSAFVLLVSLTYFQPLSSPGTPSFSPFSLALITPHKTEPDCFRFPPLPYSSSRLLRSPTFSLPYFLLSSIIFPLAVYLGSHFISKCR